MAVYGDIKLLKIQLQMSIIIVFTSLIYSLRKISSSSDLRYKLETRDFSGLLLDLFQVFLYAILFFIQCGTLFFKALQSIQCVLYRHDNGYNVLPKHSLQ